MASEGSALRRLARDVAAPQLRWLAGGLAAGLAAATLLAAVALLAR